MTPELSTGPLDITAAVATLAPAVRTSVVAPAMITFRFTSMFPPHVTDGHKNVHPARVVGSKIRCKSFRGLSSRTTKPARSGRATPSQVRTGSRVYHAPQRILSAV